MDFAVTRCCNTGLPIGRHGLTKMDEMNFLWAQHKLFLFGYGVCLLCVFHSPRNQANYVCFDAIFPNNYDKKHLKNCVVSCLPNREFIPYPKAFQNVSLFASVLGDPSTLNPVMFNSVIVTSSTEEIQNTSVKKLS
jgi:hypothetical protein